VKRTLAASRTSGMGADDSTRTTGPNGRGKPKNRSWGGVWWGLLETAVFGIEGKHLSGANGSNIERGSAISERLIEQHKSMVVRVLGRAVKASVHHNSDQAFRRHDHIPDLKEAGYSCIPVSKSLVRINTAVIRATHDATSSRRNKAGNDLRARRRKGLE
jgi:hypothetical protein